jgi:hypothetical protein
MKSWIAPLAVATLAIGCVSAPAKAPADGSVYCTIPQPGNGGFCQAATNLAAKQVTNQTAICTSMQGTVVPACPDGAAGCCATTSGSVDFDQCFYGSSAATGESMCATMMGVWTPGSGAPDAAATD